MPEGSKIALTMAEGTKAFVGTSASPFATATECGIVIRNFCPMNYHSRDSIPKEATNLMYEKLEGKFELLRTNDAFMDYVNARLQACWKRTRGNWSRYWKNNGGKTNPELARSKRKPGCRQEAWDHMCDYRELEKTQKYSDQMEANRAKQVNISRGGSRSLANHTFQLTNPETHMPPSPLQLYHKMHYNAAKQGWLNDDSRLAYENIIQHKQVAMEKLISEGTTVTTSMEHGIEKEAIKSVCGRKKTIQSGWEVGVGPVLRKKDRWMKSIAKSTQRDSSENEVLRNKVITLEAEQKRDKDKYEKMFKFISTKFPDFENTIATQAVDEGDSDNTI
ncbi:uncharacterized protein LOC143577528 [Bidens hawaiensis]|uniref:uncharacterized protein LOC143577528 n=1 Tax=Bidens hawaiensis TaxID=980011 RepID=UPI004049A631